MKSKTSPGKVSIIDLDKISSDGLQEGLIVFQLLEMGAPNSSMVKSYGRLKIFESYAGVLSIRKLRRGTVTFLVRARATYLTTINVISNKKSGLLDEGTPAQ